MGIFAQVWFWSALAFVAGALLSWALLALPARRQLASIDEATLARDIAPRSSRPVVPPLPERPGRYEDDSRDRGLSVFDDEPDDRHMPFDDEPPQVAAQDDDEFDRFSSSPLRRMDREHAARTELLSGVDTHDEPEVEPAPERRMPRPSGQSVSGPTVRVPVSGSLDAGGSLFAPPEPPIPSAEEARPAADEAATQYLPAVSPAQTPEPAREVAAPPEVDKPDDRGWFDETRDGSGSGSDDPSGTAAKPAKPAQDDESLVDDLAVDPSSQAESGELVDDVEDIDERPTGTIFTQRTQPVSGDLISRLDGKAEESSSDTEPAEEDEEGDAATTSLLLPVRKPGATRFDTSSRPSPPKPSPTPSPSPSPSAEPKQEAEATQAMPSAAEATQAVEPEGARSLFEPIVPADESKTTSMPAPVAAAASTVRTSDGSFVPPGPFGPGSAMPLPGGGAPSPEFTVKASVTALRYCEPDSPLFGRTVAEVWFRTTKDAERVGFRPLS